MSALAGSLACDGGQVTIVSDTHEDLGSICVQAQRSIDILAACNVVLSRSIQIRIVESLDPGCMGVFHCDTDQIEILSPSAMAGARSQKSVLRKIDTPSYFNSVLTHELAHAAYETVDCPFTSCRATSEYVAHTMQLMSLPEKDLKLLEAEFDMQTRVPRDSLSAVLYFMAPDTFLRKSWIHLNQRPNACSYIADIMAGKYFFDRPDL